MKVLWLCNLILPQVRNILGLNKTNGGGWLRDIYEKAIDSSKIEIATCAPMDDIDYRKSKDIVKAEYRKSKFWGFYKNNTRYENYDLYVEMQLKKIVAEYTPDIVHIWGTEYSHSLAMIKAIDDSSKIVIHIQGLISRYADAYLDGIPDWVVNRLTIRDFLKRDGLLKQQEKFYKRGKLEIEAIRKSSYVMGRTDWDKNETLKINPGIEYFKCNENIRSEFLLCDKWDTNSIESNSIFMSQGYYPIKGFHVMIEALNILKKKNYEVKLYLAGFNPYNLDCFRKKIFVSSYIKYCVDLINKYQLQDNVVFLGELDADEMAHYLRKSNIYVMPSTIENSPNSMMEAMIVGTPCIVSRVGGIPTIGKENEDCLMFENCNYNELAEKIENVLLDQSLAQRLSSRAIKNMENVQNIDDNFQTLLSVYEHVYNEYVTR